MAKDGNPLLEDTYGQAQYSGYNKKGNLIKYSSNGCFFRIDFRTTTTPRYASFLCIKRKGTTCLHRSLRICLMHDGHNPVDFYLQLKCIYRGEAPIMDVTKVYVRKKKKIIMEPSVDASQQNRAELFACSFTSPVGTIPS
ncbi:hypothetical protein POVCU2_0043440 [Plasmodium ovale curtisi]|uniref:Uncharacterized protein n=1 Tax=Plasmodium ovale curtisi TaxID=864141 RepID=A0A1A8W6F7_PLAOA|nr:hypothetical protein POVCU2_0043440 [Plasmodium ovale curtisi]SBS97686.1 hypothetical protein POVCU1_040110 [Plasmodium ovale curtisi]